MQQLMLVQALVQEDRQALEVVAEEVEEEAGEVVVQVVLKAQLHHRMQILIWQKK